MPYLPMGTQEEGWEMENAPLSKNVTDRYNCPNRFSIMYSTCYEWKETARLFDFRDHQLYSHFRTE